MKRICRPRLRSQKSSSNRMEEAPIGVAHTPVLLEEVVQYLVTKVDGIYVDATFGRGGHSKRILQAIGSQGVLICIDKDKEAFVAAEALAKEDSRLFARYGSFSKIRQWTDELSYTGKISGILLDLGVSSPQLDDPQRGFSFLRDGPLDMRMDLSKPLTAAKWLSGAKEHEIARILKEYGEERFSKRIAKAIVEARSKAPIETTGRLAEIVSQANPKWEIQKHPATRTFQALRIFINDELNELKTCLEQCVDILEVGGRLIVISFHSLEDRLVKQFINKYVKCSDIPSNVPLQYKQLPVRFKLIGKAIRSSAQEITSNIRARSAIMRIMEKVK